MAIGLGILISMTIGYSFLLLYRQIDVKLFGFWALEI